MPELFITNGRIVDPSQRLDRVANLLLRDGKVAGIDHEPSSDAHTIDATNRIVVPGPVSYTHLTLPTKA